MINDKQFLQMIESLGKNSRKSLAAFEIRNIITSHYGLGTNTKSLAASAASAAAASPNVNKARVLTDFIFRNGLR